MEDELELNASRQCQNCGCLYIDNEECQSNGGCSEKCGEELMEYIRSIDDAPVDFTDCNWAEDVLKKLEE